MAEPFELRQEAKGRLSRLGPGKRKRAFFAALATHLAGCERITGVAPGSVEELAREQNIDLTREVTTPRLRMYRRFLEFCLDDHALSDEESEDLSHLQQVLYLDDAEVQRIHDEVVRGVYGQAIREVLQDNRLDPEEEAFLERLRSDIRMSPEVADEVQREGEGEARQRFLRRSAVHGTSVVAARGAEVELEGSSESSLQEALEVAIRDAVQAVPEITSAELKNLRVDVSDGAIRSWSVKLIARL
jgi:flavin-binding protein dodecin